MRIKVGQIGLGYLGELHCAALVEMPEAELVGIFDINLEKSREIARTYGVKVFSDLPDLIDQVQALVVAVPTRQHFQIVQEALSNEKHVFVEKPISASVYEAEQLVESAGKKNLALQVGHIERFNPAVLALAAEIIHPMFIESHRLAPFNSRGTDVSVVLDLMIHDLDLILNFVRSDICKIDACGLAVISSEIDIANARIQFDNGCVANVTASRIAQKKLRKMQLFQKDAYYTIDFMQRTTEKYTIFHSPEKAVSNQNPDSGSIFKKFKNKRLYYEKLQVDNQDPLKMELESFLRSIRCKEKPVVDGVAGKRVVKLASEILNIITAQSSWIPSAVKPQMTNNKKPNDK